MRLVHREELPEEQGQDCEAVRGGYSYTGVIEIVRYEDIRDTSIPERRQ